MVIVVPDDLLFLEDLVRRITDVIIGAVYDLIVVQIHGGVLVVMHVLRLAEASAERLGNRVVLVVVDVVLRHRYRRQQQDSRHSERSQGTKKLWKTRDQHIKP
ncbi:MAG: hypothetical protein ACI9WU_004971 [Myxococcota bacterium]|jgi:hypothetical protein